MERIESYSLLFTDSFISNIAFYSSSEMVIYVMHALGSYHTTLMIFLATLGFAFSILVNYWFGRMLYKIYKSSIDNDVATQNYDMISKFLLQYAIIILPFNMVPLIGSLILVIAGFVNFSLMQTLLVSIISRLIYYILVIFVM